MRASLPARPLEPFSGRNHKETRWLHGLLYHTHQIVAQSIEVRLIPERRREGLEGLPHAVRVVVIISGMCRNGEFDQGEKILGVQEGKTFTFISAKLISYIAGIELRK